MSDRIAWVKTIPLMLTAPADAEDQGENGLLTPLGRSKVAMSAEKVQLLEDVSPEIIKLIHGNVHNRGFLVKEFMAYWSRIKQGNFPFSKAKISQKIKELGKWAPCPDEGPMFGKSCWYVSKEVRARYNVLDVATLPNNWSYSLTPKKKIQNKIEKIDGTKQKVKCDKLGEKVEKEIPLITQFTKKLTEEDMKKQLLEKPSYSPLSSKKVSPLNRQPKRVALISLPRCDPAKSPRVSLIDKFLNSDKVIDNRESENDEKNLTNDNDDCIMFTDDVEGLDEKKEATVFSSKTKMS